MSNDLKINNNKMTFARRFGLAIILIFLRVTLALRYRLEVKGLEKVLEQVKDSNRPCLFLPNHPALIDPIILYSILGPYFYPRPLSDESQANRSGLKRIFQKLIKVIIIPDVSKLGRLAKDGVEQALNDVSTALSQGDSVLLYPSGHTYRQQNEKISGTSGLEHVLKRLKQQGTPCPNLVLVRTSNLWGSRFSRAWGVYPKITTILRQGIIAVLTNFIFFMPKRKVTVEIGIHEKFNELANNENRKEANSYLENYYNEISTPATAIPLYFWQGSAPIALAEFKAERTEDDDNITVAASQVVWEQVKKHLTEVSGREDITPKTNLAADLDMDSLSIAELSVWIETEFGHNVTELDNLLTVQDVLNATQGRVAGKIDGQRSIPKNWLKNSGKGKNIRLGLPKCQNLEGTNAPSLLSLFLAQARKNPKLPIIMDYATGSTTFRKLLIGVEALAARFSNIPGERLGIMLPCSPAVISTYFATLSACKTPVMVNWTLGVGNIKHCLNLAETETIVTARALTSRLVRQGFNIDAITTIKGKPITWIYLEDIAASLSLQEKLSAAWRSRFSRKIDKISHTLRTEQNPYGTSEIAAILFTSGSEALPKAVPLTHANIMANFSDAAHILHVSAADRILGMLPPFHSLGLLANVTLPLLYALPMACHSNPTESGPLVNLVKECELTVLASTPSFLEAMLERAKGTEDLKSLRLAFIGAEKCPEHVFAEFKKQCPNGSLCEGYGVTECSPVLAINRPDNIHPGTIGEALPSVEIKIVKNFDSDAGHALKLAEPNDTGMIIARGPNVFSGYLSPPAGMDAKAPTSPFVEFDGLSWYSTGDLASCDEEGIITFKGRLKRFVKLGGEMISLPQIENILLATFANRFESANVEGPVLAVESKDDDNPEIALITTCEISREEANDALRTAGLSGLHSIRRVLKIEAIPLLGTGKTNYRQLKELL